MRKRLSQQWLLLSRSARESSTSKRCKSIWRCEMNPRLWEWATSGYKICACWLFCRVFFSSMGIWICLLFYARLKSWQRTTSLRFCLAADMCISCGRLENFCVYTPEMMSGFVLCFQVILFVFCFMRMCIICQADFWPTRVFIKLERITIGKVVKSQLRRKSISKNECMKKHFSMKECRHKLPV